MTRIVIGYDSSDGAGRAVDLVASLAWKHDSVIRVVSATPDVREIRAAWGALALRDHEEIEREIRGAALDALERPLSVLRARGLDAQPSVSSGRAAAVLEEQARELQADLVVVGSRGLGDIESRILGSVSMEVVDRMPCPTLVARSTRITRVLFATDGSDDARAAGSALARLPLDRSATVQVVSVVDQLRAWMTGVAPGWHQRAVAAQLEYEADHRRQHEEIVAEAIDRLHDVGIPAAGTALEGRPAAVVLDAAASAGADLIVLGSRGRTGLTRLVLGSVSRHIAHHAPASILIAQHASDQARRPGS